MERAILCPLSDERQQGGPVRLCARSLRRCFGLKLVPEHQQGAGWFPLAFDAKGLLEVSRLGSSLRQPITQVGDFFR